MPIVHMSDILSVVYSPSHLVKLLSYLGAFHLFTYASIGGGGFNTDAYKCPQGGRGGSEHDKKYDFVRMFIENATLSETFKDRPHQRGIHSAQCKFYFFKK